VKSRVHFAAFQLALACCCSDPAAVLGQSERNTPFVVPHALAKSEKVYVCERAGWADVVARVPGIGEARIERVPAFDRQGRPAAGLLSAWTTDEWLFGWLGSDTAVLRMPGDQRLAQWGRSHFAPLVEKGLYINPFKGRQEESSHSRFDAGGAIMASPPIEGYPHGRLIVARDTSDEIKDFLRGQGVQVAPEGKLIELDTAWLKVGHVDELVNFVPASTPRGFLAVVPDPKAGLDLIRSVPPQRAIFYSAGSAEHTGAVVDSTIRGIETARPVPAGKWTFVRIWKGKGAGQVAKVRAVKGRHFTIDGAWDTRDFSDARSAMLGLVRAIAGRCETMPIWFDRPDKTSRFLLVEGSQMWIDSTGEEFPAIMAAGEMAGDNVLARTNRIVAARCLRADDAVRQSLGIEADDAIRLPALFASEGPQEAGACPLLPSLVNLQTFNREIVLLRPFGPRRAPADDESDVILDAAREALTDVEGRLHFLNGWDALHRNNGGPRCGMNVWRRR